MRPLPSACCALALLLAACGGSPDLAEHAAPGALLGEGRTVYVADFNGL
ncbi:MAG: hypothetical protein ACT4PV_12460 [Planctomycetaceae bacterium]